MVDPEGSTGEFTIIVHNEFQGRGLGFKLVDIIIGIAQDKGLSQIWGTVTSDNVRMLELTEALGFSADPRPDGITRVSLELR
jgi:acetyltransferase